MRNDWSQITRHWVGRFSFTFLVIAFFLGWEAYKKYSGIPDERTDWRTILYCLGAAASLLLAFTGLRERYRR